MKRLIIGTLCALFLLALATACKMPNTAAAPGSPAAEAATAPAKLTDDQIIAWVNDKPIPKSLMDEMMTQIPPYMMDQFKTPEGMKHLAENLIGAELVYQKATAEGFEKKPEVKEKLQQVTKQVIYSEYLQKVLDSQIQKPDEAEIKKFYDGNPQLADKPFDQVKDQIAEHLNRQAQQGVYEKFINGLKTTAQIRYNEKLFPAATPAPAAPAAPAGVPGLPGMELKEKEAPAPEALKTK